MKCPKPFWLTLLKRPTTSNSIPTYNLPKHSPKLYQSVGECIYCGLKEQLTDEHIIPFSAGGCWVLPRSSCKKCASITGAFEGEFSRTILGPLRMLHNMPTRRKKDRPRHLPLKVKYPTSTDWEVAYVDRDICPFLVILPLYSLPKTITGLEMEWSDSATKTMWVRGGGFWPDRDAHLQWLCDALKAMEVMPTGTVHTEPFCLTLAKIAHAFAVAELGMAQFTPFLTQMICAKDLSHSADFIGGGKGDEPPGNELHEIAFDETICADPSIIVVRLRLFSILGTPTYHIAVGRKL